MADVNLNVNAPAEQAPVMTPPTRTDDQILPRSRWQFWDTIRYDRDTATYNCQVDKQWFDLTKDTLRDALQITRVNNNNLFSSPPTPDALINFVNKLEKMWEEFTQSIHSFVEDKKNLAVHTQGKKKVNPIVIPSIRFTKLIIHHLQSKHKFHPRPDSPLHLPYEEYILRYLKSSAKGTKREVFGMPIPNELITADIQGEQYYKEYLEKVAKHQRLLALKSQTRIFCIPYPFHQFIIMSNINNNMQTQTSNTLHIAIMEAGSKDRPPMLALVDLAIEEIEKSEAHNNMLSKLRHPSLKTKSPLEEQAFEVLTPFAFKKFQEEFERASR
nr:protein FAR1-related sequence 11 [Tanacetum cinerariifolium]